MVNIAEFFRKMLTPKAKLVTSVCETKQFDESKRQNMIDKLLQKIELEKMGFKEFLYSGAEPYLHPLIETVRLGEDKIEGPTNPHEWPQWYNVASLMWRPFVDAGRI